MAFVLWPFPRMAPSWQPVALIISFASGRYPMGHCCVNSKGPPVGSVPWLFLQMANGLLRVEFDHDVRLWRVADGTLMVTREDHSSSITGLSFSPDGTLLASANVDTTVRLWKMPSMEPYDLLKGHTDFVFSVAFSPDGHSLASGSADNTVRVWDVPAQSSPEALEYINSPQDCASCHHPQGATGPARRDRGDLFHLPRRRRPCH